MKCCKQNMLLGACSLCCHASKNPKRAQASRYITGGVIGWVQGSQAELHRCVMYGVCLILKYDRKSPSEGCQLQTNGINFADVQALNTNTLTFLQVITLECKDCTWMPKDNIRLTPSRTHRRDTALKLRETHCICGTYESRLRKAELPLLVLSYDGSVRSWTRRRRLKARDDERDQRRQHDSWSCPSGRDFEID